MSEITELNKNLIDTSNEISIKSGEINKARMTYLTLKDEYERDYSSAIVQIKTTNPDLTQTDIRAIAIGQSYNKKLELRVAEGEYRALMTGLKALQDKLTTLQEMCYNIRSEMRLTNNFIK